jgi:hypothetical protein
VHSARSSLSFLLPFKVCGRECYLFAAFDCINLLTRPVSSAFPKPVFLGVEKARKGAFIAQYPVVLAMQSDPSLDIRALILAVSFPILGA